MRAITRIQVRALIVDTDAAARRQLADHLREHGETALEAAHVDDVVDAIGGSELALLELAVTELYADGEPTVANLRRIVDCPVVVLTNTAGRHDIRAAVRAGAAGYLLKSQANDELLTAMRAAAEGGVVASPALAATLLELLTDSTGTARAATAGLTAREIEVLAHAARGLTNRRIAEAMGIAENTVKNHVRNILEKLHLHSRLEAVLLAVREGVITPD